MKTKLNYLGLKSYILFSAFAFLFFSSGIFCQGVNISGGSKVSVGEGVVVNIDGGITIVDSGSIDNKGIIKIGGDWTNILQRIVGGFPAPWLSGIIEFNGKTPQSIIGTQIITFSNLTINNPNGVYLKRDVKLEGLLTFMNGKLFIDSTIIIQSQGHDKPPFFIGASETKYIVTSDAGNVILTCDSSFSDLLVPIGDSNSYAPVILSVNGISGGPVDLSLSTKGFSSSIDQNGNPGLVWVITKGDSGSILSYNATFDLTYTKNTGDIQKYIVKLKDTVGGWTYPKNSQLLGKKFAVTDLAEFGTFEISEPGVSSIASPYANLDENGIGIKSIVPNSGSGLILITYTLGTSGDTRLELFNTLGQSVAVISDGFVTQGVHQSSFNASFLPDGSYYLHLTTGLGKAMAILKVIH